MQANFNNITACGITYLNGETNPPCHFHYRDPNGYWNFWCPVTGDSSGSSTNPRTEYRETGEQTNTSFNWLASDFASNRMEGVCEIARVPSSQKVIFAQVHAVKAPAPYVKLLQSGQELRAEVRYHPAQASSPVEIRVPLGDKKAHYSIEITGDSRLIIVLNEQRFECLVDPAWNAYPFYFKAGAYVIDTDGPETEGGWVIYESLDVYHK